MRMTFNPTKKNLLNLKSGLCRPLCLLAALVLFLLAATPADAQQRTHVVKPGQNLYRISLYYGVTVQALLDANPGISESHVPAGKKLIIPSSTKTPDKGALDALPVPKPLDPKKKPEEQAKKTPAQPVQPARTVVRGENWCQSGEGHWSDGVLNITVMLPFNLNSTSTEDIKTQMRNVEFYQGLLMAVDEMQTAGRKVKVQAFDTGSESLYSLLVDPLLQQTDLVIFAGKEDDLRRVAEWSDKTGTPVVSPYDYSATMQGMYSNLFQVNTPKSMLYPQLTRQLLSTFEDYTVVFVTDKGSSLKADPYSTELKRVLTQRRLAYKELDYTSPETLMACDSILGLMDANLLFVPVTPQAEAMHRMFSGLQHVKFLREMRHQQAIAEGKAPQNGMPQIAVLGYPEWVLYTSDFINYYYDLNVYMFSKFYASPFDGRLKTFYAQFKRWYGKEPMSLALKYALLGYDVANTFLQSLTRNGQHLTERIASEDYDGLQMVMRFNDNDGRGFHNEGCFLVHFTPESTIEKIVVE